MNRQTFEQCPRRTIQARPVTNSHTGEPDMLWRVTGCAPDRWHYWQNPCNCYFSQFNNDKIRTPRDFYANVLGWPVVIARPETGTWKRDGHGVNSIMRAFRREIRARRETQTVAHAAVGPRPIGRLTSLPLGQIQREWLDKQARTEMKFMGVPIVWDKWDEEDTW